MLILVLLRDSQTTFLFDLFELLGSNEIIRDISAGRLVGSNVAVGIRSCRLHEWR
jgi:hypothetical protein